MKFRMDRPRVVLTAGGLILGGALLLGARVLAKGIPTSDALVYSGVLEFANGDAVNGKRNIGLAVYDQSSGGRKVCELDSSTVDVQVGHFTLALPGECVDAVQEHADLWVQITVEGSTLGRTKLGAVPYAIEAEHATRADTAEDATGALDDRLVALETTTGPASALRALQGQAQDADQDTTTTVRFGNVDYDENQEFNTSSGTFTAKARGIYAVNCRLHVASTDTTEVIWGQTLIAVNGAAVAEGGLYASDYTAAYPASALVRLAAGDAVTCAFKQNTLPTVTLTSKGTFEVALVRGLGN